MFRTCVTVYLAPFNTFLVWTPFKLSLPKGILCCLSIFYVYMICTWSSVRKLKKTKKKQNIHDGGQNGGILLPLQRELINWRIMKWELVVGCVIFVYYSKWHGLISNRFETG